MVGASRVKLKPGCGGLSWDFDGNWNVILLSSFMRAMHSLLKYGGSSIFFFLKEVFEW